MGCGHMWCSGSWEIPPLRLECACTACANPRSVRLPPFSRPLSGYPPLLCRPPLLCLWCADGTSSTQRTSSILSLHMQILHREDVRERGRRVPNHYSCTCLEREGGIHVVQLR